MGAQNSDLRDFVKEKLDKNGGYITEWELDKARDAEKEKALLASYEKPYFRVPGDMIMDWDGDCYAKNAKTYGKECTRYGSDTTNKDFSKTTVKSVNPFAKPAALVQTDA